MINQLGVKMNKKIFKIIGLLIIATMLFAESRTWYTFNEGIAKAEKENKHIIIDFYTDWCGWCKQMDKKTFSDPEVSKFLFDNFIPIRINAENMTEKLKFQNRTLTPREIASAFRISGFPSVAFLTSKSEIIVVIPGFIEKEMFMNLLKYMNSECYRSKMSMEEFLKKDFGNRQKK